MRSVFLASPVLAAIAAPALAAAAGPPHPSITPVTLIEYAVLPVKLVVILLLLSSLVAIAICIRKLATRGKLPGGSAFISGLRLGGPIFGGFGAAYGLLNTMIGISMIGPDRPLSLQMVAPGLAEGLFTLVLGFLAGGIAVIAYWALESKIDRQVLRG